MGQDEVDRACGRGKGVLDGDLVNGDMWAGCLFVRVKVQVLGECWAVDRPGWVWFCCLVFENRVETVYIRLVWNERGRDYADYVLSLLSKDTAGGSAP